MGLRVTDLIEAAVVRYGDRIAVADESGMLTFKELHERAGRCAAVLHALGVAKGDRVGMAMANRREWVEVEFGIALCGGIRSRLNARDSQREFEWILNDTTPRVVVADTSRALIVRELVAAGKIPDMVVLEVGDDGQYDELIATHEEPPEIVIDENDLYLIMHTSGTTGKYKGAVYTHRAWANLVRNLMALLMGGVSPSDRFLHVGPLSHQSGVLVLPGLLCGMRSEIRSHFDPDLFFKEIEAQQITHTMLSPTMVNMLVQAAPSAEYDLSSLKSIYYSASPIASSVLSEAMKIFGPILLQVYGSTEAPYDTILYPEDHVWASANDRRRLLSCGRKTPFCDLRLTNLSGEPVEIGELGEVRVRSDAMSDRYWNAPEATAEAFVDGWFRMGDLAVQDVDGFITIVDRVSEVIISGGLNIYPREIEDVLASHPAIREVCVIGVPDERWGEAVKACVVLREGAAVRLGELQLFCVQQGLASYKKPLSVDVVAEIPSTAVGKPSRRLLRETYWSDRPRAVG